MCWKSIFYLLCIALLPSTLNSYGQESKARIKNVDFEVVEMEGTKIVVHYDIVNASPVERFEIELAFVDDEDYYYYPKTTTGDVGVDIKGGKGKRIIWDLFQDVEEVGRIQAIVVISSIKEVPGGPVYALLSVPVPGLGNVFVTNTKNSVIKPYYTTIAAYGLVGYGIYQKTQATRYYDDYLASSNTDEFNDLYDKANSANHQFYIFASLGAALWISDVITVTVKGFSNKKKEQNTMAQNRNRFTITPNACGGFNVGYVLNF